MKCEKKRTRLLKWNSYFLFVFVHSPSSCNCVWLVFKDLTRIHLCLSFVSANIFESPVFLGRKNDLLKYYLFIKFVQETPYQTFGAANTSWHLLFSLVFSSVEKIHKKLQTPFFFSKAFHLCWHFWRSRFPCFTPVDVFSHILSFLLI